MYNEYIKNKPKIVSKIVANHNYMKDNTINIFDNLFYIILCILILRMIRCNLKHLFYTITFIVTFYK